MSKSKSKARRMRQREASRLSPIQGTDESAEWKPRRRVFWRWVILLLLFLAAAIGTYYVYENFIVTRIPAKLVGKWGLEGAPADGATMEFFRNGTVLTRFKVEERPGVIRSRATVEGKILTIVSTHPKTGERKLQTQMILQLDAEQLVLKDDKGKTVRMLRLR